MLISTAVAEGEPVKKPTRWMSNSRAILNRLDRQCSRKGGMCSDGSQHTVCNGTTARKAAIYPFDLCKAILEGFRNHVEQQGRPVKGICALTPVLESDSRTEDQLEASLEILKLEAASDKRHKF